LNFNLLLIKVSIISLVDNLEDITKLKTITDFHEVVLIGNINKEPYRPFENIAAFLMTGIVPHVLPILCVIF
jgi:hypothetical protein